MADCHPSFAIRRVAVPAGEWTALCAAIECIGFGFRSANGLELRIRTDKDDPQTEDIVYPNAQELIIAPVASGCVRFGCGASIAFVQPVGDVDDTVVCRFVR